VLITSFRPSALAKLGLAHKALRLRYPALVQIAIVGGPGAEAGQPGHDLTYMADGGLVAGTALPPTLYADMGGSLLVVEAVLQSLLARQASGKGVFKEVALSSAVEYLALPRHWGLTTPSGTVGGAHAGYGVYACQDGRVAVAALEPRFARALCEVMGLVGSDAHPLLDPASRQAVADFFKAKTRAQLDRIAAARDIPLHTMK
jgi:alpha-methylacyl-CoA racemase